MATIQIQNRLHALEEEIHREIEEARGIWPAYLYDMIDEAQELARQLR